MGIQKCLLTLVTLAAWVTLSFSLPSTLVNTELVKLDETSAGSIAARQGFIGTPFGSWSAPMTPVYHQLCGANNPNDQSQCILVVISDDDGSFVSLYLYDNYCNEIGAADIVYPGQDLSFGSQLPYTLEFTPVLDGPNQWWYAGRHWGGNDGYENLFCFNTASPTVFRPACKMVWQCR